MPSASVMNLMLRSSRNTLRIALLALLALPLRSYAAQALPGSLEDPME
jgi:hypothetical protein